LTIPDLNTTGLWYLMFKNTFRYPRRTYNLEKHTDETLVRDR